MNNIFNISDKINNLAIKAESNLIDVYKGIDDICYINTMRVLKCFKNHKVSTMHFNSSSGYGYDNVGREVIEKIYANIFDTEKALVRSQFINGTHAISTALFSLLRNGDELVYITGKPYDTLHETIGITDNELSLKNLGVKYTQIDLLNKDINIDSVLSYIKNNKVKVIAIQRSKGYGDRKTLSINDIKDVVDNIKKIDNSVIILVDNCYGELTDISEPTSVGADICCGSLIKNIGGGLCETGAYIAGISKYVDLCADRLNGPGMGYECGATLYQNRNILQGLFLAPNVVSNAIKSMVFAAYMLEELGFDTYPRYFEKRNDIIQTIKFKTERELISFIQGIQNMSPIDSFLTLHPWDMPGYNDKIIMAAGTFIEGASIELSADAPIREPYIAYMQGGLTYHSAKIAICKSIDNMLQGI